MIQRKPTAALISELNLLDESDSIEAKEISGTDVGSSFYETVCALSNEPNLSGGIILLGVKRDNTQLFPQYNVTGIKNPDRLSSDIVSACQNKFNFPIRPKITRDLVQKKVVVRIEISELSPSQKPLFFPNIGLPRGAYRRLNSSDVRCTIEDMEAFIHDGVAETHDAHIVPGSRLEDIDIDSISLYRRYIKEFRPSSEVLGFSDKELLISTNCVRPVEEKLKATAAGIIVLGRSASIRRFFPQLRADYIRVPGKEWISDVNNRFASVDMRGPAISLIDRIIAAISDDLPKRFQIDHKSARRLEVPVIPNRAIREAVVNAVMHRTYKIARPLQIIRYSNRLVIENPGYSLKAQEQFDNPGSITRNPHVAAILHETHFAETKGTGLRVMRQELQQAGLSMPTFESDRTNDIFRVTFLFHHLLGRAEWDWLGRYKEMSLTEDQMIALVFVRETGEISNSSLRDLAGLDTLKASASIRKLRENGLIEKRGKGNNTDYTATKVLIEDIEAASVGAQALHDTLHDTLHDKSVTSSDNGRTVEGKLPSELRRTLLHLRMGKRAAPEQVTSIIVEICKHGPFSKEEISIIVGREPSYVAQNYLSPLVKSGSIEMTIKEQPSHPNQRYQTSRKSAK